MKKKKERNLHSPVIPFKYNQKVISKATDFRIYRDAILITPGEFCDSMTRSPVTYTDIELSKSATNWSANYLNVDHSFEVQKRIGWIKNPKFKNNSVKGDLYIHTLTDASRETIALIDNGLINWISVEITTEDNWNAEDNKRYASNIEFIGAAVVTSPADESTRIIKDGPAPY